MVKIFFEFKYIIFFFQIFFLRYIMTNDMNRSGTRTNPYGRRRKRAGHVAERKTGSGAASAAAAVGSV